MIFYETVLFLQSLKKSTYVQEPKPFFPWLSNSRINLRNHMILCIIIALTDEQASFFVNLGRLMWNCDFEDFWMSTT